MSPREPWISGVKDLWLGMGDTIVMVSKSSILTKVSILSILAKSIGKLIPLGPAMFLAKRVLFKAGEGK